MPNHRIIRPTRSSQASFCHFPSLAQPLDLFPHPPVSITRSATSFVETEAQKPPATTCADLYCFLQVLGVVLDLLYRLMSVILQAVRNPERIVRFDCISYLTVSEFTTLCCLDLDLPSGIVDEYRENLMSESTHEAYAPPEIPGNLRFSQCPSFFPPHIVHKPLHLLHSSRRPYNQSVSPTPQLDTILETSTRVSHLHLPISRLKHLKRPF